MFKVFPSLNKLIIVKHCFSFVNNMLEQCHQGKITILFHILVVIDYMIYLPLQVNPNYQAALTALSVLEKKDLEEVKSFRQPPEVVKFVLNAICLLFDVPQT